METRHNDWNDSPATIVGRVSNFHTDCFDYQSPLENLLVKMRGCHHGEIFEYQTIIKGHVLEDYGDKISVYCYEKDNLYWGYIIQKEDIQRRWCD